MNTANPMRLPDGAAWDDREPDGHGNAVPTVAPVYPVDDPSPEAGPLECSDDTRAAQREAVARLLAVLMAGRPTPEKIGRRVLALGILLRAEAAPESAAEFARMLGVSRQRAAAIVDTLRVQLADLQGRE